MIVAVLLFITTAFIYFLTFGTSIYGADSGDLAAAIAVNGVAHPPGYPLYLLIARLFLLLPLDISPAGKINFFSLVTSLAVILFSFFLIERLVKNKLAAFIASLTMALTVPFWLYSSITEVFPLNNLFVLALLFLAITINDKVRSKKSIPTRLFYLFAFILGLSITHHHTIILIFPSLAILLFSAKKYLNTKIILVGLACFLLGLLPYLYLPIASFSNPPINWDNPKTLTGFLQLISRADYGTITPAKNLYGSGIERLNQIFWFVGFLQADFTVIGIIVAILGGSYLYFKNRILFWSLVLGFLISGPIFLIYADFETKSQFVLGVIERFLFIPYIFFTLFFAFGLAFAIPVLVSKIIARSGLKIVLAKKRLAILTVQSIFIILPLFLVVNNFAKTNLKDFKAGDKLGIDALETAETKAMVILQDDTVTFNSQYVYYGLKKRPDLIIIVPGQMRHKHYREQLKRIYPQLTIPEDFDSTDKSTGYLNARYSTELVGLNLNKFPIYAYSVGPNVDDWEWVPVGIMVRLYLKDKKPSIEEYKKISEKVWASYEFNDSDYKNRYRQLIVEHIIGVYKFGHVNTAKYYMEKNAYDLAQEELNKAIEIDDQFAEGWIEKGRVGLFSQNCQLAKESYEKAYDLDKNNTQTLIGLRFYYQDCEKDDQKVKEVESEIDKLKPQNLNIPLEKF